MSDHAHRTGARTSRAAFGTPTWTHRAGLRGAAIGPFITTSGCGLVDVDVGVIGIETVILDVHVHGNDTVRVLSLVDEPAPQRFNGRITIRVSFKFTCTVTDPITSTSTPTDHDHDRGRLVEEL